MKRSFFFMVVMAAMLTAGLALQISPSIASGNQQQSEPAAINSVDTSATQRVESMPNATEATLPLVEDSVQMTEVANANWNSIDFVRQLGGIARIVGVQGDYAYILGAGKLTVLDISDPLAPIEVDTIRGIRHEVTNYNQAFVHNGLILIGGMVESVETGQTGYIQIINIRNPTVPLRGGYLALDSPITGIGASGNHAFLIGSNAGMYVIDIGNYSSPTQKTFQPYDRAASIAVVGSYAYVHTNSAIHASFSGRWDIIDITDPSSPSPPILSFSGRSLNHSVIIGNYLYMETGVLDVSDPSSPRFLDNGYYGFGPDVRSTVHSGNHLYATIADFWNSWLSIIDVTSPESPTLVKENSLAFEPNQGMSVVGNYVLISDITGRVRVLDASEKTAPVDMNATYDALASSFDVAVADQYIYSTDYHGNGLNIVDVSNPSAPRVVGTVDSIDWAHRVVVSGNYAYVAASSGLYIIDVTNKVAPYLTGKYTCGDSGCNGYDLAIKDQTVYMTSTNQGVLVIDVSDKANPGMIGQLPPYKGAWTIAINGDFAYVWVSGSIPKLYIIDTVSLSVLGSVDVPGQYSGYGMTVANDHAYVGVDDSGLAIVDVSDPSAPRFVRTMPLGKGVRGVEAVGNRLFVSNGYEGIQILSIEDNPAAPIVIAGRDTDGIAQNVALDGDMIYVADEMGGLVTLRYDGVEPKLPDYTITAIEVTQAIQDLENTVPLITGKKTYARVHVENVGASSNVPITAELCLGSDCRLPDNKHGALPSGYLQIPMDPDRGKLNDGFYFLLPDHWVTEGANLALTAIVNSDNFREADYNNNVYSLAAADEVPEIRPSYPLKIKLLNVNYATSLLSRVFRIPDTRHDLEYISSWIQRAYPLADNHLVAVQDSLYLGENVPFGSLIASLSISGQISQKLQMERLTGDEFAQDAIYYGAVIDGDYSSTNSAKGQFIRGVGGYQPNVALGPTGTPNTFYPAGVNPDTEEVWDRDGYYGDWYAGHELGHVFLGTAHIDSTDSGCGDVNRDQDNPYAQRFDNVQGRIGGPALSPTKYYGFDTNGELGGPAATQLPTASWHDVMTYCPNIWVSHHFYEEVLAALRDRSVNSQRTQASVPVYRSTGESTTEYLLISAFVNFTQNTADFKPSYRIHSDSIVGLPAVGDHSLVLLDHNGSKLITYSVQISSGSDNDPDEDEYGLLVETVPWIDGTAQIALQHNGQTLATQNVSAATPQVTVDQPNGHEFITDVLEVGWSANDADGDALSYTVQYSHDGGQSWDTVGTGITNTLSVHLDAMHLPGSDNALVRVMASDGVNTSIDQSDQPFSVAHKVPEPIINSPADGETYVEGQTIGLFGDAYDVEDGYLRDAAITWTSDRSGILGTGTSVYPENMALGPHQITMMATDSDGNQSTATITLTIQQAPKPPSRASQPSPTIGATDVPIGASLSWTGGDPNPDDTVSYDVYFDTVDPPVLQVSSLLSATSYDPPGDLLPGMTYYWQVIAHDSSGLQTAGPVWSFTTTATAAFTLQSGWNMVSSHVQPGNPAVSSVLAGIVDEVVLMKNGDGQVYWPAFGINEIGDWDVTDGYQIYMSNPTALAITGTAVDPSATPIPLIAGWNMAAYLLGSPLAIDQALASIDGALYLAKNGDGQVYWPAFGVNQIGEMQPGQGYQLYMSNAGTLVYPGN